MKDLLIIGGIAFVLYHIMQPETPAAPLVPAQMPRSPAASANTPVPAIAIGEPIFQYAGGGGGGGGFLTEDQMMEYPNDLHPGQMEPSWPLFD